MSLSPSQLHTLENVPQLLGRDLLTNSYSLALFDEGLESDAFRIQHNFKFSRAYRGASLRKWRDNHSSSMLRTDPQVAFARSRDRLARYSRLQPLIESRFTVITFEWTSKLLDNDADAGRKSLLSARKALKRLFLTTSDNLDTLGDSLRLKSIVNGELSHQTIGDLKRHLPPGILLRYYHRHKSHFLAELQALCSTHLPTCLPSRARFEHILKGVFQSVLHNFDRSRFVLGGLKNTNLPTGNTLENAKPASKPLDPDKHRHPTTGELPVWVTVSIIEDSTDLESLPEHKWIKISDLNHKIPLPAAA